MCNPSQSLVECGSLKVIGKRDMARLSQQPAGDSSGIRVSKKPVSELFIGYSFILQYENYAYYILKNIRHALTLKTLSSK